MRIKLFAFIFVLLAAVCHVTGAEAQTRASTTGDKTRVLIILDCSHSMWDRWQSDSKIKVTQKVLLKFLDSVANQQNIEVALRVFGHLNKNSYGTRLEVPFEKGNNYKIQSKMGYGVDFMQDTNKYHGSVLNEEDLQRALAQLPQTELGDY